MTPSKRTTIGGVLALAALSLAGCTAEAPNAGPPASPTSVSSPSASPSASTTAAPNDEALLPLPADEISDWAEGAVPLSEGAARTGRLFGWLSQNTSPHQRNSLANLPAGSYQAQLACRGTGTITMSAGELDDDSPTATTTCTNSTIAFEISIEGTGMTIDLDLDGDPTIYAISLIKMA